MLITKEQLAGKPKKVGEYRGLPVMENSTKGGLHFLFAVKSDGGMETLGMGSHPAIARYVAECEFPEVKITSLEKSEDLPRWIIEREAPAYVNLTMQMRELE